MKRFPRYVLVLAAGCLAATGCDYDIAEPDTGLPVGPLLTLDAGRTELAANGSDTTRVSVTLGASIPDGMEVAFEVAGGGFRHAGSDTAGSLKTRARLRSATAVFVAGTRSGPATVRATVAGVSVETTVSLTPALPSEILLTADKSAADTTGGSAVVFTARLLRDDGTVSRGLRVRFRADDGAGTPFDDLIGDAFVEGTSVTHSVTSSIPRTVVMRAEAGGVESNTVTVVFR